jgi:SAM-dependent methyltransferase
MDRERERRQPDPVIEAYKRDVDLTLIRENLRLSVEERFEKPMRLQEFAEELRRAGRGKGNVDRSGVNVMRDYDISTYGERIADVYDEQHRYMGGGEVDLLAGLAGAGRALELGVGTGRVALPLSERGVEVHGIDASPAMVARLRSKPGGERIQVTVGDFADVAVGGEFALVYVVFNTFFALLTQDEQVRCFRNVAARLAPGGVFLLEAFVPDMRLFEKGQTLRTSGVTADSVSLHSARHDPATQKVVSQQIVIDGGGVRLYPVQIRYCWPSELDLMARLAGLRLRERRGGWRGEPFDDRSEKHVSVYERAD